MPANWIIIINSCHHEHFLYLMYFLKIFFRYEKKLWKNILLSCVSCCYRFFKAASTHDWLLKVREPNGNTETPQNVTLTPVILIDRDRLFALLTSDCHTQHGFSSHIIIYYEHYQSEGLMKTDLRTFER